MNNLIKAINNSINSKNKVHNYRLIDTQQTYRCVKMLASHFKCNLREAYIRYANFLYN